MRQRVEDLGRICELLRDALDSEVFDYRYAFADRPPDEERSGMLRVQIELLQEILSNCLEISEGEDRLNRAED